MTKETGLLIKAPPGQHLFRTTLIWAHNLSGVFLVKLNKNDQDHETTVPLIKARHIQVKTLFGVFLVKLCKNYQKKNSPTQWKELKVPV